MPPKSHGKQEAVQGLISIAGRTTGPLSDHADHHPTPNGYLLIIADGKDDAFDPPSRLAIREIKESFGERRLVDPDRAIAEAFQKADEAIRKASGTVICGQESGMKATATALLLESDAIHVGHVGDGRAYRVRGSLITRMTTDHTFVRALVESGVLHASQARASRYRHALIRALGGGAELEMTVAVAHMDLRPGDIVVLCSDSVADVINDLEVGRLADSFFPPDAAANALVELAMRRGAPERVMAIVVRVG